ncbi:TPA: restriction endonuclease subunit S [Vibrio vulnificus]
MIFDIEKYSTLPKDWSKVKLSDLADFNAKSWSKKDKPNTIHYIDISSVSTGRVENPTGMLFDEAPSRARRKVSSGDIIISTVRPNLKQFALLDFVLENLTASTGFCTITPKKAEYTWLIYSIITTDIFTEHLVRVAQGAAYPAIKPSDIADAYVGLPPEHELMEFNLLVSALWQKQSVNETMNQTLEKIAQRIFKSWFIDFDPVKANKEGLAFDGLSPEIQALFPSEFEESELGMIPKEWEVKTFEDMLSYTIGGDWGKDVPDDKHTEAVRIIRGTDFPKAMVGDDSSIPFRYVESKKLSKRKLIAGDILIEVSGGSPTQPTGRVIRISDELLEQLCLPVEPASFCRIFRPLINVDKYAYLHLRKLYDDGGTWKYQNQSTGISNFQTKFFLSEEKIAEIPDEILNAFNHVVNPLFDKMSVNAFQNSTLSKLRDRLLPKLISGQITVGEAQKELAEVI